jgi:branched-subunit amino acid transport protein
MTLSSDFWIVVILLGIGTFSLRLSFLGLIGGRDIAPWALRLLRYVPVAVMPGLVAPLVLFPAATNGETDPARLGAAIAALIIGAMTRNTLGAVIGGLTALYLFLFLL